MNIRNNKQKIIVAGIAIACAVAAFYFFFLPTQHLPKVAPAQQTHTATRPATSRVAATRGQAKIPVYPDSIKGKIITLKKMTLAAAFDYYTMFSPAVRKGLEYPEETTFGEIEYNVQYEVNQMKKGLAVYYNIWDNRDDQMIGSINIREKKEGDPGQLGMWLNEKYWGGGRIQEAQFLISQAYFKARPENDDYIVHVRQWNIRSYKSMEKFGFIRIGTYPDDGKGPRYIYKMTPQIIKEKAKLRN